jgi:hypothetical protein
MVPYTRRCGVRSMWRIWLNRLSRFLGMHLPHPRLSRRIGAAARLRGNFVIAAVLAVILQQNAGVPEVSCVGSLTPNTSVNGRDDHNDQISSRRALWLTGQSRKIIAYEYQTFGGHEFIQFLIEFRGPGRKSVAGISSPSLFPYHGSVFDALQDALRVTRTKRNDLPDPFSNIRSDTTVLSGPCRKGPRRKQSPHR